MKTHEICHGSGRPFIVANTCPLCPARFAPPILDEPFQPDVPAHIRRHEPSAPYSPRMRDAYESALFLGCHLAGYSEEQTIDMLSSENRRLRGQILRISELSYPPPMAFRLDLDEYAYSRGLIAEIDRLRRALGDAIHEWVERKDGVAACDVATSALKIDRMGHR